MRKTIRLLSVLSLALLMGACNQPTSSDVDINGEVTIHPAKYKQTVWGIGFEIQSDAIGSGNTGLPEDKHAVPHDLTPEERERFAKEMLTGFRYCRLAGGLYWRGLDPEKKYLQPRWPEQLVEIRKMIETAGVEGLSLEYWSPAPYWKANFSYLGEPGRMKYNTLRCFGPEFDKDPVYQGDTARFLKDFGEACVRDIETLKKAGLKVSMWGMQNEPEMQNAGQYSTCKYHKGQDYVKAYAASAGAVRKYNPDIMLFSDTHGGFPKLIATGMNDSSVAKLVDAYVVHTIGWDSESVNKVHKKITERLPKRPWFQNEYEYLQGGATPKRCLNTVQHIMNSFQLAENPTWYWIHALKPFKNSEASGYSLGFWKSLDDTVPANNEKRWERWVKGPEITTMPEEFKDMEFISPQRRSKNKPGVKYSFILNQPATAYILVEEKGGFVPEGWTKTDIMMKREGGTDAVYTKELKKGKNVIGQHTGREGELFGTPHACFVKGSKPEKLKVQVGINSPIRILSEALKLERAAADLKPGHWFFNDYNWNAVGSFVKHMPWDAKVIDITEKEYNKDARVLVFERPNGKLTVVVSNRTGEEYAFKVNTGKKSKWQGYRYTPWERGENTMGVATGKAKGTEIVTKLPDLAWEFWEEQ